MGNVVSMYGGKDPRELPFYTVADAARYLRLPSSTLRAWCGDKEYRLVAGGHRKMAPILRRDPETKRLTFHNLVEAFVVSSITRVFQIRLADFRLALDRVGGERPLIDHVFHASHDDLYIEATDRVLVDIHRSPGQIGIRPIMDTVLSRIAFDVGKPERFSPWRESVVESRVVSIDARRAFGRPTVSGRSLKVESIIDLFDAGESVETIASGYDLDPQVVQDVLAWGGRGETAAA